MGRSIPVVIGNEFFSSKEAAIKRIRSLIGAYPFEAFLNDKDRAFCMDLFEYNTEYSEKVGPGVSAIQVRRDEQGNRYFHLHRVDGTDIDISWPHCISPKKETTVVLEALRSAVKDQIQEVKASLILLGAVCPFHGIALDHKNSHLDHYNPTFQQFVAMFLASEGISLTEIRVEEQAGNDFRGLPADKKLHNSWRDFHATNARLRLISARANLSDAKKRANNAFNPTSWPPLRSGKAAG